MKYLLLLLTLTLQAEAQTLVQATNYLSANGVTKATGKGINVTANAWADYAVNVPTGGYYDFAFTIRNTKEESYINVKTPTGSKKLGTALVPTVTYWRYTRHRIKLRAGTTKLRLVFGGDFFLDGFQYKYGMDTMSKPGGDRYVTQKAFDAFMKDIKRQVDILNNRVVKFNDEHFYLGEDSTIMINEGLLKDNQ